MLARAPLRVKATRYSFVEWLYGIMNYANPSRGSGRGSSLLSPAPLTCLSPQPTAASPPRPPTGDIEKMLANIFCLTQAAGRIGERLAIYSVKL